MAIDYIRIYKLDMRDYAGKTLEEKRAQSILGDYYAFIKFCKEKLPEKTLATIMVPSHYFRDMGAYQFYPIRVIEKEGPEYIIVFHPDQKQIEKLEKWKGYAPYATFKPGEFILKRKENS